MPTITPDEARARFGELVHAASGIYREFEDPDQGIWRPVYADGELLHYRLYRLHRLTKRRKRDRTAAYRDLAWFGIGVHLMLRWTPDGSEQREASRLAC